MRYVTWLTTYPWHVVLHGTTYTNLRIAWWFCRSHQIWSHSGLGAQRLGMAIFQCFDCVPGLSCIVRTHTRHVEWEAAHPLHVVCCVSMCTSLSWIVHKADYAPASATWWDKIKSKYVSWHWLMCWHGRVVLFHHPKGTKLRRQKFGNISYLANIITMAPHFIFSILWSIENGKINPSVPVKMPEEGVTYVSCQHTMPHES